jgi:hypothetical protein
LKNLDNAIASLKQIDKVLDILQVKKEYTNADLVAMGKIVDVLELKEKEILSPK